MEAMSQNASNRANSYNSECPTLVLSMTDGYAAGRIMPYISVEFRRNNRLPRDHAWIVLEDEKGIEYKTKYTGKDASFGAGWPKFAHDHQLKSGDALVFELIEPKRFKVHIFRAYGIDEAQVQDSTCVDEQNGEGMPASVETDHDEIDRLAACNLDSSSDEVETEKDVAPATIYVLSDSESDEPAETKSDSIRKFCEERRYKAAEWLREMVGVIGAQGLPAEPSEEEFRLGLQSGVILCNVLNYIQPRSVPKVVESALENVKIFLVVMREFGLPEFDASDLEQGGKSERIVNSVLALKSYNNWKQTRTHSMNEKMPEERDVCDSEVGARKLMKNKVMKDAGKLPEVAKPKGRGGPKKAPVKKGKPVDEDHEVLKRKDCLASPD